MSAANADVWSRWERADENLKAILVFSTKKYKYKYNKFCCLLPAALYNHGACHSCLTFSVKHYAENINMKTYKILFM